MKTPDVVTKAWKKAIKVRENSYSPYSKFAVGASIVTSKGDIFTGCNVENAVYNSSCAERNAIFTAVSNGQNKIKHIVVVTSAKTPTPPCGFCRQVIAEFADPKTKVWIYDLKELKGSYKFFEELLPLAFTPKNLK